MKRLMLLLLLFAVGTCVAQNTYQPGYYISNDGTRKDCLIKNIAWKDNPSAFMVKLSESGEPTELTIKEVSEFSVGGTYKFRRYDVPIDRSGATVDKLSTRKEPEWSKETVFLKVLVEGAYDLMEYDDNNFQKFFYSAADHRKAEQLVYKQYTDAGLIKENIQFRQQLYNLMKDKIAEVSRYESIAYKRDALKNLFLEYNGNEATDLVSTQSTGKVNLRITAEARLTSVSVSNMYLLSQDTDFDKKLVPVIGAEIEYVLPFNNNKWALFANPSYQSYSNSGKAVNGLDLDIKYTSVELPLGARHYFFLNADSRIYVQAAYVLAFKMGDAVVHYNETDLELENTSNFALGAGFAYKKLNAGIVFNIRRGLSDYNYWGFSYNSVGLAVGYNFL